MNKKGFVLAEAIVVAVFVLGMFTYLAMNIFPLITKYDQAINYDNPNEVYMANVLYDEILQTGKIDDLEEGMYSFKVDEENNNIDVHYTNPDGTKTEDISSLNSKFFQTDYYKNLIHNELRIKNIVVLKADAGDRVGETAQSILSTKSGLTRGMRNYYNYLKGRKEFSAKRFSILVEFASGKYASVSLMDSIYCFLTDASDTEDTKLSDTEDIKLKVIGWESACGPVPADLEIPNELYLNNDEDGSKFLESKKTVITIASSAFQNKNIESLTLPYSIETIGYSAFQDNQISKISYKDSGGNIEEGSLPLNLQKIDSYAFKNNQIIGELKLNKNLKEIGEQAFYIESTEEKKDQNLKLKFLKTVTTIGDKAFAGNHFEKLIIAECNSGICSGSETGGNSIFGNSIKELTINSGELYTKAFYGVGVETIYLKDGVDTSSPSTQAFYENEITKLTIEKCTTNMCSGTTLGGNQTFNQLNGNLTIRSGVIGDNAFSIYEKRDYGYGIKDLTLSGVTGEIGDNAFKNNYITQLNLSATQISKIGSYAFHNNEIKGQLVLPSTLRYIEYYAFSANEISSLANNNIYQIGDYAFANNEITTLTLPNISEIGDSAFQNNNTRIFNLSTNLKTIGQFAFRNSENTISNFTLPSSVTSIGESAFLGNSFTNLTIENTAGFGNLAGYRIFGKKITNLTIRAGDIGNGEFNTCGIKNLILKEGVTSVGQYSFANNKITSLQLPSTLTTIGVQAFYSNKISELKVPKTVYNIGTGAFVGNAFTNLTIEKCNSTICSSTQQSATGGGTGNRYFGNNIINLTIEGGTIGKFAFAGMASNGRGIIKKLVLGPNVTSVGYRAFMHNRISVLQMSEGPIEILQEAFYDNSLTSITIPQTVTTIGKQAFAYQTNDSSARTLKNITIKKTRANFLNTVTLGTVWYDTALNPTITCAGAPCTLS